MKIYLFDDCLNEITVLKFAQLNFHTAIFICWRRTVNYFIEYARSLNIFSFLVTFEFDEIEQLPFFTDFYPNCLFVYPTNIQNNNIFTNASRFNCCLFNSEQMSIPKQASVVGEFLNNGGRLINYSQANQQIIENICGNHDQMLLLPYVCCENEVVFLNNLLLNTNKIYDFAVVCSLTPRRKLITDDLTSRGVKLCIITDLFGKERDQKIAQCRSLLNIHASEEYKLFESIRCNRWLAAGMTVVCETCSDDIVDCPNRQNLHFIEKEQLVDFCINFSAFTMSNIATDQLKTSAIEKLSTLCCLTLQIVGTNAEKSLCFFYGAQNRFKNVTNLIYELFYRDMCFTIGANASFNLLFEDVLPNVPKFLHIVYGELTATLPEKRFCKHRIFCNNNSLTVEEIQ